MKIIINVSEEARITTDIQGAKAPVESTVYSSPKPGNAPFGVGEVSEGQTYDAGAAPIAFEESTTLPETTPTAELEGMDGGIAPQL